MSFGEPRGGRARVRTAADMARRLLPEIPHPARVTGRLGSIGLSVPVETPRSSKSGSGRPATSPLKAAVAAAHGRTIPRGQLDADTQQSGNRRGRRRVSAEQAGEELKDKLVGHLRSGGFYAFRDAFGAFDQEKLGKISLRHLHRLILNLIPSTTKQQFKMFLKRSKLDKLEYVTFEELYKYLQSGARIEDDWTDPIVCHPSKPLTAGQADMLLRQKARDGTLTAKDFSLGRPFTSATMIKPELRDALIAMEVHMDNAEFDKLWARYNTSQQGLIDSEALLVSLGSKAAPPPPCPQDDKNGVEPQPLEEENIIWSGKVAPPSKKSATSQELQKSETLRKTMVQLRRPMSNAAQALSREKQRTTVETVLLRMFNQGYVKVFTSMKAFDTDNSGFIPREDFRDVLARFGVRLTPPIVGQLLLRCGYEDNALMVPYEDFLEKFFNRSAGSLVNSILSDPSHVFHRDQASEGGTRAVTCPQDAGRSVSHAESRVLSLLQGDFLSLLSAFKSLDTASSGSIGKAEFCAVLATMIDAAIEPAEIDRLVTQMKALTRHSKVNYLKVLHYLENLSKTQVHDRILRLKAKGNNTAINNIPPQRLSEITRQIRICLHTRLAKVTETFEDLDFQNTGQLTQSTLQSLLNRLGIKLTWAEVARVWDALLKTANNTLEFQEFIRHFCPSYRGRSSRGDGGRKYMSDEHHFMRSKTLNRDEDIVEDRLRGLFTLSYSRMVAAFHAADHRRTGIITAQQFSDGLSSVYPQLSDTELHTMTNKVTDTAGKVNYQYFMRRMAPHNRTYRVGNDMSTLLSHDDNVVTERPPPTAIATNPTLGLPGALQDLRKKVRGHWTPLVRALKDHDPGESGVIKAATLDRICAGVGLYLSNTDHDQLQEFTDPKCGKVNYHDFFGAMFK